MLLPGCCVTGVFPVFELADSCVLHCARVLDCSLRNAVACMLNEVRPLTVRASVTMSADLCVDGGAATCAPTKTPPAAVSKLWRQQSVCCRCWTMEALCVELL